MHASKSYKISESKTNRIMNKLYKSPMVVRNFVTYFSVTDRTRHTSNKDIEDLNDI